MRRLAHLSDLHFGRVDPAAVEGLARSLEAARPDLVVVSGDFTQSARTEEFIAARAFLDRLPAPAFAVPGNHDLPQWDPVERLVRPYDRYRRFIGQELEPVWSDAEVGIVGMKSPRRLPRDLTRAAGRVGERQLERLLARLDAMPPELVRVVVVHHPLLLPEVPRRPLPAHAFTRGAGRGLAGLAPPRGPAGGGGRSRPSRGTGCGWCCPATFTSRTRVGTSPSPQAKARRRWRCRKRE